MQRGQATKHPSGSQTRYSVHSPPRPEAGPTVEGGLPGPEPREEGPCAAEGGGRGGGDRKESDRDQEGSEPFDSGSLQTHTLLSRQLETMKVFVFNVCFFRLVGKGMLYGRVRGARLVAPAAPRSALQCC